MDDEELAAELEHVRADLVERASGRRDFQRYLSIMDLHMRAAWLLIALGRYDEAIASASEANRTRTAAVALTRQPPPGAVLWQACEAKAVAHLARRQWSQVEEATHEALRDFEEEDKNYRLHELALQAQGRLHPNRIYKVSKDPARELAEFDAKRYALHRIQRSPAPS